MTFNWNRMYVNLYTVKTVVHNFNAKFKDYITQNVICNEIGHDSGMEGKIRKGPFTNQTNR